MVSHDADRRFDLGPFELTKLSAQISVLMARNSTGQGSGGDDSIRRDGQSKGTFRTAAHIIKQRGLLGLYSGFHLHLRAFYPYSLVLEPTADDRRHPLTDLPPFQFEIR